MTRKRDTGKVKPRVEPKEAGREARGAMNRDGKSRRATGRREMKLSEWAQREGIPLRTAQRRFRDGSLPVPTFVTKTGRLMVIVDEPDPSTLTPAEMLDVIFDLKRQLNRIERKLARKDGASD